MNPPEDRGRGPLRELGRFLEIQNLGLNLPFAVAFLLVASGGLPTLRTTVLLVVAFVAARNAGHSFNRWTDRDLDAQNPRTRDRALVTGRLSPRFALGVAALSGAVVIAAAFLLSPLAFLLSPVALLIVFGYSLTKRRSWATTVFLGLVEAVTPAAAFVAVTDSLPLAAWTAVAAMLLWGTAFETIHSLGDLANDLALRLPSLPAKLGVRDSLRLIPALHGGALVLFAVFGYLEQLEVGYFLLLAAMAVVVAVIDRGLTRDSGFSRRAFQLHFLLSGLFLVGTLLGLLRLL